ncbi:MAG TPA: hypothetical protein DEP20_00450 [Fusobacteria bacterium]|nr:hypothetical protein [Fusobacteriota bacterium]
MILPIFCILSNLSYSKVINIALMYRGKPVDGADVGVKFNDKEISTSSNEGLIKVDVEDAEMILVKAIKEGYGYKGYIGKPRDLNLEMKPKYAAVTGRVAIRGTPIRDQKVTLENLWTKEQYEYSTNSNGNFVFERIPIKQSHILRVLREGYLPFEKEVTLNSETDSENEIYLNEKEYIINVKVKNSKNRFIFIEGISAELDETGIGTAILSDFMEDRVKIIIDGKEFIEDVDKSKRFQNFVISVPQS